MNLTTVAKLRCINQQLSSKSVKTCAEMVAWLGAMQAQEFAQTKWALGLRLPHLKETQVEKDFTEGKILRTHLLRPTWHFVTPDDIRWMLKLTAPRVHAINATICRRLELDNTIFNRCIKILTATLQGNKHLNRSEINAEFKKKKIRVHGIRLSYIMMYAELDGIICSGARRGNQFTYALLDERVPASNPLNRDEALSKLAKQYFTSRGPATLKDFSTWSGLMMADCKKGLDMIKKDFIKEVIEENEYYFSTENFSNKKTNHSIYFLPTYDEFIMGYKDRSAILEFKKSLKPSPIFRYDCMIISDGQIIGTWKRTIIKKSINIEFEFFKPLNKNQDKEFFNAIHRFEHFTNMSVNYTFRTTLSR